MMPHAHKLLLVAESEQRIGPEHQSRCVYECSCSYALRVSTRQAKPNG